MGLLESVMGKISGEVHFYVFLDRVKVAEIRLEGKQIVVDIKSPAAAIKLGFEEYMKKKDTLQASGTLKRLKKMGYSLKIKYKFLEFEI